MQTTRLKKFIPFNQDNFTTTLNCRAVNRNLTIVEALQQFDVSIIEGFIISYNKAFYKLHSTSELHRTLVEASPYNIYRIFDESIKRSFKPLEEYKLTTLELMEFVYAN